MKDTDKKEKGTYYKNVGFFLKITVLENSLSHAAAKVFVTYPNCRSFSKNEIIFVQSTKNIV